MNCVSNVYGIYAVCVFCLSACGCVWDVCILAVVCVVYVFVCLCVCHVCMCIFMSENSYMLLFVLSFLLLSGKCAGRLHCYVNNIMV